MTTTAIDKPRPPNGKILRFFQVTFALLFCVLMVASSAAIVWLYADKRRLEMTISNMPVGTLMILAPVAFMVCYVLLCLICFTRVGKKSAAQVAEECYLASYVATLSALCAVVYLSRNGWDSRNMAVAYAAFGVKLGVTILGLLFLIVLRSSEKEAGFDVKVEANLDWEPARKAISSLANSMDDLRKRVESVDKVFERTKQHSDQLESGIKNSLQGLQNLLTGLRELSVVRFSDDWLKSVRAATDGWEAIGTAATDTASRIVELGKSSRAYAKPVEDLNKQLAIIATQAKTVATSMQEVTQVYNDFDKVMRQVNRHVVESDGRRNNHA